MIKTMLFTLPLLFLLLDYCPLNRLKRSTIRRALFEKIPLLVLSAIASAETLISQHENINLIRAVSWTARIGNAFRAIWFYVWQTFYPHSLAVFYPFPGERIFFSQTLFAIALFVAITVVAWAARKKMP